MKTKRVRRAISDWRRRKAIFGEATSAVLVNYDAAGRKGIVELIDAGGAVELPSELVKRIAKGLTW